MWSILYPADTYRRLSTIGYSNNKPDDFIARLKGKDIDLIIDVRLLPGAWLGCYRASQDRTKGMPKFLWEKAGIRYKWFPALGKPKKLPMRDYQSYLMSADHIQALERACKYVEEADNPCLLCCEGDPYVQRSRGIWDPNCHRVIVGENMIALMSNKEVSWAMANIGKVKYWWPCDHVA